MEGPSNIGGNLDKGITCSCRISVIFSLSKVLQFPVSSATTLHNVHPRNVVVLFLSIYSVFYYY